MCHSYVYTHRWRALQENAYSPIIYLVEHKLDPKRCFFNDQSAQIACLAIRIGLHFDATRAIGRTAEIEQVESYMRIVLAVPRHREFMWTGAPSEPVLAETAAQLLNWNPNLPVVPWALYSAFQQGILAREQREEIVARMLWTLAHDKVLLPSDSEPVAEYSEIMFHKPISVLDFLRNLFHQDHWQKISSARPVGDANGPTLEQAFENAYIHFSHFMDAMDDNINFKRIYQLLLRGAALICPRNQCSIDFLTPILFGSPDSTTLSGSNTSVLQAQVKRCNEGDELLVGASLVKSSHPILSLVHDLQTPESSVECTPPLQDGNELHARHYQIVSRGCSSKIFGVIPNGLDERYQALLGSNVLEEDFLRRHVEGCMPLFRQLQPYTGLGQDQQENPWFGKDVE